MSKALKNQRGFTLIELVMVIVILAILGAVAIPIYVDLRTEARDAATIGVAGAVQAGITTYFVDPARGNRTSYPTAALLDPGAASGACTTAEPCFEGVLAQGGITAGGWTKASATSWTAPNGSTWTYAPASGSFTS